MCGGLGKPFTCSWSDCDMYVFALCRSETDLKYVSQSEVFVAIPLKDAQLLLPDTLIGKLNLKEL